MNGQALRKLLKINALHALYRADGRWYHHLKRFPGILFDNKGYVIFETEEKYLNNPFLQHKKDLHIKNGISTLVNYQNYNEEQNKLLAGSFNQHLLEVNEETIRVLREISFIIRDRALSNKIKTLYDNACQVCGTKLEIKKGVYYSEVHHIIPLGYPYNGLDTPSNMICVCPNDHVLLDLKVFPIVLSRLKTLKHDLSSKSVLFHNNLVQKC